MAFCSSCGKEMFEGSSFCEHCGRTIIPQTVAEFSQSKITEEDLTTFIGKKAYKYLSKFKTFNISGPDKFSITWHWPAFFLGFCWLFYRKLYLWAILAFLLSIIPYLRLFAMPFFALCGNYIYYKHAKKKILRAKTLHSLGDVSKTEPSLGKIGGVNWWIPIFGSIFYLAVCANVAIPQFFVYRTKAYNAAAESDLRDAAVAQQTYYFKHGAYADDVKKLAGDTYDLNPYDGVNIAVFSANQDHYRMIAFHEKGNKRYSLSGPRGTVEEVLDWEEKQTSTNDNTITTKEDWERKIIAWENYLRHNPDWKNEAWLFRAEAYKMIGNINPEMALNMYNKGLQASTENKYGEAINFYKKALKLDPKFPWSANNLAWELSTCPDEKVRNGSLAIKYSKMALENTKVDIADFYGTLAAAYAANAEYDKAVVLCKEADQIYPDVIRQQMLKHFVARKPFIDHSDPPRKENQISSEGYGKARWGMSKIGVIVLYPEAKVRNNSILVLESQELSIVKGVVELHFVNDMLYKATVHLNQKNISEEDENYLKKYLLGKYGNPSSAVSNSDTSKRFCWRTDETIVDYIFDDRNHTADIVFTGRKIGQAIGEAEEAIVHQGRIM